MFITAITLILVVSIFSLIMSVRHRKEQHRISEERIKRVRERISIQNKKDEDEHEPATFVTKNGYYVTEVLDFTNCDDYHL